MNLNFNMGFSIPTSNALSGIGSSLGVGGNYYRYDKASRKRLADDVALQSDWEAVGRDLGFCMSSQPHVSPGKSGSNSGGRR